MTHTATASLRRTLTALALVTTTAVPAFGQGKWFEQMKIGPAWSNTFAKEIPNPKKPNEAIRETLAVKGILIDLGNDNHALFDTETLRVVSAYKGGIKWGGTPWTGEHGKIVAIDNQGDKAFFNTPPGPGWADASGNFTDKRPKELF